MSRNRDGYQVTITTTDSSKAIRGTYHAAVVRKLAARTETGWIGTFTDAAVRRTARGYAITFGTISRVYATAAQAADAIQLGAHTEAGRLIKFSFE